ncbi:molybdopterin/thiamine biosynthesis adenylyltransferase [Nocardia tenerifensis]|uniref:Molybdopterin/thiamine biosynthesis adenylyltransferase n=1 Tax=Nocardia tenerifensis TaxID=228006 RepID=A0A318JTN6_9NOCA|nr:ThiF family adenylyltransferase [Nocardia tenerifensis]PXX58770.1 molybdopterin/thiamine biosynthesis adenylyltransferase [Nocardia tenerifensis]
MTELVRLRARTRMIWSGDTLLMQLGTRNLRLAGFDEPQVPALHELSSGAPADRVRESPWMAALLDGGFLEAVAPPSDDPDLARFDRLLNYLSELESDTVSRFDLLARLRGSSVLLVGLGGMASWVAYNLLCCGIGNFTLVDGDTVEASNLNRSILYTEQDIGRPKVLAAAHRMREFAPRTEIRPVRTYVGGPEDLRELAEQSDLVLGLADQPPWRIKEWVAAVGLATGTPFVQASGGRVGPFHTRPGTACTICDWTRQIEREPRYGELLRRQSLLPRGNSGALSPVGSITSGIVCLEVVRYLLGMEPTTADRIWEFRGDLSSGYQECPPHPRCGLCGSAEQRAATPSESLAQR